PGCVFTVVDLHNDVGILRSRSFIHSLCGKSGADAIGDIVIGDVFLGQVRILRRQRIRRSRGDLGIDNGVDLDLVRRSAAREAKRANGKGQCKRRATKPAAKGVGRHAGKLKEFLGTPTRTQPGLREGCGAIRPSSPEHRGDGLPVTASSCVYRWPKALAAAVWNASRTTLPSLLPMSSRWIIST